MKRLCCLFLVTLLLCLFGCPNEQTDSQSNENTTNNQSGGGNDIQPQPTPSNKITSLQDAIKLTEAGGVIDLSDMTKYEITDYNATVNKKLTIKNGNLMNANNTNAVLNVTADSVVLNNIQNASVTTQSSMKISGSTLSNLSIAAVSSSSPSHNQIIGRGDESQTVSDNSSQPPMVEVTDNTVVNGNVSVAIPNAYLTVESFTAKQNVSLDAANVQLMITGTAASTSINKITTDQICQVILEDGTSDSIPTPTVSGEGELKQIDMTVKEQMELLALTPMSGLKNVIKKDESIDFSNVVVLGTYQATGGITLFKANGLSETLTETFSKIEKNFIVKIGNEIVYENGEAKTFDWTKLSVESPNQATLDLKEDTVTGAGYQPYSFDITVIGASETQTEIVIPEFELTDIELLNLDNVKRVYNENDPLNMTGLLVMGTYSSAVGITYQNVISNYTLTPSNGTSLTPSDNAVKVKVKDNGVEKEKTVPITVNPIVRVTFIDASNDTTFVQRVVKGQPAKKPADPTKTGYIFDGWYEENVTDVSYDFTAAVTDNLILNAKWTPISYTVKINCQVLSVDIVGITYDCSFTIPNHPVEIESKWGYTCIGWATTNNATVPEYADRATISNLTTVNGAVVQLYPVWKPKHYTIYLLNSLGSVGGDNSFDAVRDEIVPDVAVPTRIGYTFDGYWYNWQTQVIDANGEGVSVWDFYNCNTLEDKWLPNHYTIEYKANGGVGDDVTQDITYDVSADLRENTFTQSGYKFIGWAETPAGEVVYTDKRQVKNLTAENNGTITLYAKWEESGSGSYIDDTDGNMVIDGHKCLKTSLIQVLTETTTITWKYTSEKGAFPKNRVDVTIPPYKIGQYEVTQELFNAVWGANPSDNKGEGKEADSTTDGTQTWQETNVMLRPVEEISWFDAFAFCNKLSIKMGKRPCYSVDGITDWAALTFADIPSSANNYKNLSKWEDVSCDWENTEGYRLPTDCEWECAARGGDQTKEAWSYAYTGGNTRDKKYAWFNDCSMGTINPNRHTWEVGIKLPNSFGLYDMYGNVGEMCWDLYQGEDKDELKNCSDWRGPSTGTVYKYDGKPDIVRRVYRGSYYNLYENDSSGKGIVARHQSTWGATSRESSAGLRLAQSVR